MKEFLLDELEIRLKAPIVAMEKIAADKSLPKVFARVALDELKKAQAIVKKLQRSVETSPARRLKKKEKLKEN